MKTIKNLLISSGIFILLFVSQNSQGGTDSNRSKIYHDANIAYQKLDYEKSILLYEQLVKSNYVSLEIYYNLGNSYFKAGNFAKAIVNYERALKIAPDDEDVNFNLKIASLKVVDKIETVPEVFYKKWTNDIASLLPADTWTLILIFLVWLLFGSAAFYIIGRTVAAKKTAFIGGIFILSITCITAVIAKRSYSKTSIDEQGIVMSSSVYIKSSPDEKGNDLFILHEGTKVEVLDQLNDWKKIRIANGSVGWMKVEEMEKI
jgi:tetratricopeptide (TPR) repeat protein